MRLFRLLVLAALVAIGVHTARAQPQGYPSQPTFRRTTIANTTPQVEVRETDAAANETRTIIQASAGLLSIESQTDAGGAGSVVFSANRSGSSWDNVTINAGLGHLTMGGSTTIRGIDGAGAASPAFAFVSDTNTGMYAIGSDRLGFSLGGVLTLDLNNNLGTGHQLNLGSDGTTTLPRLSWAADPDTGIYRSAANTLAITAGGTTVLTCATTGCTGVGQSAAYGGWSDNAATAEDVPAGWSVSLTGNTFTWTHNLGLVANTDLAVTVTPQVGSSEACRVNAIAANSFDVICYTTSTGGAANVAHFVTAVRN